MDCGLYTAALSSLSSLFPSKNSRGHHAGEIFSYVTAWTPHRWSPFQLWVMVPVEEGYGKHYRRMAWKVRKTAETKKKQRAEKQRKNGTGKKNLELPS